MGNSASSSGRGQHDDTVDFGHLTPQGLYSGPRDWNETVVGQLIIDRKLAPFYRPLEDYEEAWDDEQILAARREPPASAEYESRSDAASTASKPSHHKRASVTKEPSRNPEAAIYTDAAECPICFLYYPANINRSRCCDQAICTECFVQIKRAEPTVTHLVSEPACCPYCVQENFGIIYTPPVWRTGIGSDGSLSPTWPESPKGSPHSLESRSRPGKQRRRKSYGHTDPEVVTTDQIRPDWEAKLAAVRAAATRRANRRIIMRQVGDRLIPVGVTSGRVHALPDMSTVADAGTVEVGSGSGRRSRRRQQQPELNQLLGSMGLGGQDLEELMVMEAMRLSLVEHEEQQRKEAEERAKKAGESSSQPSAEGDSSASGEAPANSEESSSQPPPQVIVNADEASVSALTASTPPARTRLLPESASVTPMPSAPPSPSSRRTPLPPVPDAHLDVAPASLLTPWSQPSGSEHVPPDRPYFTRMSSFASSVNTSDSHQDTTADTSGYGFLPSESEESIVAREPLLHSDS
ncbi:hypothetical protein FA95DRAFT_1515390 [Auriscalpium vulgare]|uniref:Uncharacterized protein n=1 Tax=Auriscalpium vulgare TaxID=40419 RepID=A0ACB8S0S0_9AGAM|nr:hypothetical protein FA95DRAFT_1515390 [Auriscalpium vulgare]